MMFFKFYFRSFKSEKELGFYRLQNSKKIVQGLNFCPPTGTSFKWHFPEVAIPLLAILPTGTSPSRRFFGIFLCHWEFEFRNCRYTEVSQLEKKSLWKMGHFEIYQF